MATDRAIRQVLAAVAEVYNRSAPSEPLARIWTAALELLQDGEIQAALIGHMRDRDRGRFAPTPADIFEAHRNLRPDPMAQLEEAAQQERLARRERQRLRLVGDSNA